MSTLSPERHQTIFDEVCKKYNIPENLSKSEKEKSV